MGCVPASKSVSTSTYDTKPAKINVTALNPEPKVSQEPTKTEVLLSPATSPPEFAATANTSPETIPLPSPAPEPSRNLSPTSFALLPMSALEDDSAITFIKMLFEEQVTMPIVPIGDELERHSGEEDQLETDSRANFPQVFSVVMERRESLERTPSNRRPDQSITVLHLIQFIGHSSQDSTGNNLPLAENNQNAASQDNVESVPVLRSNSASAAVAINQPPEQKEPAEGNPCERFRCKICYTNFVEVVILPCGHALCSYCAGRVDKCPYDRSDIIEQKMFFCA